MFRISGHDKGHFKTNPKEVHGRVAVGEQVVRHINFRNGANLDVEILPLHSDSAIKTFRFPDQPRR